jgi:hypothetical protein
MKQDVLQKIYGTNLLLVDHPKAGLPMIVPRMTPEQDKELTKWRQQAREKMR